MKTCANSGHLIKRIDTIGISTARLGKTLDFRQCEGRHCLTGDSWAAAKRQPSTIWYAAIELYMRGSVTIGLDPACSNTPSLGPRQQLVQRGIPVSGIGEKSLRQFD